MTRSYVVNGEGVFRWKRLLMGLSYSEAQLNDEIEIDLENDVAGRSFFAFLRVEERDDGNGQTNEVVEHFGDVALQDAAQFAASGHGGGTDPGPKDAGSGTTLNGETTVSRALPQPGFAPFALGGPSVPQPGPLGHLPLGPEHSNPVKRLTKTNP